MAVDPKRLVRQSYDRIAERYAVAWGGTEDDAVRRRYLNRAMALVTKPRWALDLGCGTGAHVTRILAEQFEVVGVDISARSIEIARREVPAAQFMVADMASIAFPDAAFDLVVAFYSMIHVPRDEHAGLLARIARWLRPHGVFVATMGAGEGGEGTEDDWLGAPMFWSSWGAETNLRLISEAGLHLVASREEVLEENGSPVRHLWVVARRP